MRIVGYIGIALLMIIAGIGLLVAIDKQDWYGAILMLGFMGILAFLGHTLRSAARRTGDPALGWYGASLTAFLRGPVLHTPEGFIVLAGSAAIWMFSLLAWFAPTWVGLNPARAAVNATGFALWPILLFVLYVKWSAPHFQPNVFTRIVLLIWAGIPFYMAYK